MNFLPAEFSAYAPGGLELLGNHTDYNQGVVLGAAIDCGLTTRGCRRDDGLIVLRSKTMGEVRVPAAKIQRLTGANSWANYVLGVAREISFPDTGFEVEISGELPAGSGLSSSAALEVSTALFLLKLQARELPRLEIAKACQRAEHHFVGVRSGLLDQVTSLFGERERAVFFDCRSEEVRTIPSRKDSRWSSPNPAKNGS